MLNPIVLGFTITGVAQDDRVQEGGFSEMNSLVSVGLNTCTRFAL